MTYQILLDDSGDIDLSTGQIQWIDGSDAIIQHIKSRLNFAVGNFIIYPESGMPYFLYVFGSKNKNLASNVLKQRILDTPGVKAISDFYFDFNNTKRILKLSFKLTTIYGNTKVDNMNLKI